MRRWRGDDITFDALPPRPSLDQLRRRAKELRDAARSGDLAALGRITAAAPATPPATVRLAAAQLAIAREHGYSSWPRLVADARARTTEAGQRVAEFLAASTGDWTGRAARMLARDPWIAGYDVRTALVLGDAAQVREMLAGDPGLATRTDEQTGWTALHAACASRWHRLDPVRAAGLTEVARLLLEAGARTDVTAPPLGRPGEQGGQWAPRGPRPVWCARLIPHPPLLRRAGIPYLRPPARAPCSASACQVHQRSEHGGESAWTSTSLSSGTRHSARRTTT